MMNKNNVSVNVTMPPWFVAALLIWQAVMFVLGWTGVISGWVIILPLLIIGSMFSIMYTIMFGVVLYYIWTR